MFNLLMFNVDWQSGRAIIPMGRMFEYTDDHIADQFRQDGGPLLDRLILFTLHLLRGRHD